MLSETSERRDPNCAFLKSKERCEDGTEWREESECSPVVPEASRVKDIKDEILTREEKGTIS